MKKTKYYTLHQNNVAGRLIINNAVKQYVSVEAD